MVYADLSGLGDTRGLGTPGEGLKAFLAQADPGNGKSRSYVALQAYVQPDPHTTAALQALRTCIQARQRLATTVGYGPRFLHSTAHAECFKLLRSTEDGQVFGFIPHVAGRYHNHSKRKLVEIWKPNRQARSVKPGWTLRIQALVAFWLRSTKDEWQEVQDTRSTATALGIEFVDIEIAPEQRAPVRFTFR